MSKQEAFETAACMGFDALRICFGLSPRNYTVEEVQLWMKTRIEWGMDVQHRDEQAAPGRERSETQADVGAESKSKREQQ